MNTVGSVYKTLEVDVVAAGGGRKRHKEEGSE